MLPARDGDCLFVEVGPAEAPFRILIDGGRRATAPAILGLMETLPGPLDLMVLTHVDADHIEGLLEISLGNDALPVAELWFNGVSHTETAAGHPNQKPTWPPPAARVGTVPVLNAQQAVRFANAIRKREWAWNRSFAGGPIMIDNGPLPAVPLPCGGRIVLLGPPRNKLAAMRNLMISAFQQLGADTPRTLALPTHPPIDDLVALAKTPSTPDTTIPNGASIAFVLEHGQRRVLFTADAHPTDLAASLQLYQPGDQPVRFDAIKVPHHGSARNNTEALLAMVASPLWLVSTNGAKHGHPDPSAIARIVLANEPSKIIQFNYRTAHNEIWAVDALQQKHRFSVRFNEEAVID